MNRKHALRNFQESQWEIIMLNEHFCATGSAVVSAALMLVGSMQAGYADSLALVDGGTASEIGRAHV